MKRKGFLAFLSVLALPALLPAGELADSYKSALKKYLEGDFLKAAGEYEYMVTLGTLDPLPTANLALMYRDMGQPEVAAAHWLKATLLAENDPFFWNLRAWNYLALSRYREARDAFKKAVAHSTDSVHAAEAHFGLGLTDSIDGNNKAAVEALQRAVSFGNPYLRAAADAELGRVHARMREPARAAPLLTSSLSHDQSQLDVARLLGGIYEKTNQANAAWQAYKFVLDMFPADETALKRKEKLERYIPGNPADSLPLVRLARPMMRSPEKDAAGDLAGRNIRVQMFAGPDGKPRHLTKFYVMGSSTTRLYDILLDEEIASADDFTQWEILYRPDNRVIEVRDNSARIIYVTKQPFRLDAVVAGHTVLLKNPEMADIRGMDLSDRELRGSVEVLPTPFGFHIVNELPLDQYLFSVIGQTMPRDELVREKKIPMEAYKALAVLLRSKTLAEMDAARPNPERTHTCDCDAYLTYKGLTRERKRATQAVRDTRGMTVTLPPKTGFEHHLACGWSTAAGIQDRAVPKLAFRHPYDLEKLIHEYPDPEQFSEASADVPQIWNRWLRVLDAEELRENAARRKDIGPIRHVRAAKRDETGRVRELVVEGSRGELKFFEQAEIASFLSPGSLRSTLFALQPVYQGKKLARLLVWGAGTGHGRGLCVAGTLGQAHSGRSFVHILRHYFPGIAFHGVPEKLLAQPLKPVAVKKEAPKRRRILIRKDVTAPGSKLRAPRKRTPESRRSRRRRTTPQ